VLTSELTAYYVDRLNKQNNIPPERDYVIARVIAELAMGLITPGQVTTELQKRLSIDGPTTVRIAREIRDVMLAPIQNELLSQYGIDLRKIPTEIVQQSTQPAAVKQAPQPIPAARVNPMTTVNLKPRQEPAPQAQPQKPVAPRPAEPIPAARVMEFKPRPVESQTPQPAQSTEAGAVVKKIKITEATTPFTLKEENPGS